MSSPEISNNEGIQIISDSRLRLRAQSIGLIVERDLDEEKRITEVDIENVKTTPINSGSDIQGQAYGFEVESKQVVQKENYSQISSRLRLRAEAYGLPIEGDLNSTETT